MKIFILLLFVLFASTTQAQILKKLEKAVKRSAERTIERRVEKETSEKTDEMLDQVFERDQKNKANKPAEKTSVDGQNENARTVTAVDPELNYTGTVIFQGDFSTTALGDFPGKFISSAGGEVVQTGNTKGLLFYPNSNVLLSLQNLPENFALAFDLTLENVPPSLYRTAFNVYVQELNVLKHNDPKNKYGAIGFSLWGDKNDHQIDLFNRKAAFEIKEKIPYDINENVIDRTSSWVILRNGDRLRLFINGEKITDAPNLLQGVNAKHINLRLDGTKKEENHRFIISQVKVTAIKEDIRTQLIEKGTLSTSEIYFASGSDQIQKESFELLNEIAATIKDANANFLIIGHTDSDGDAEANLSLSQRRAASVKQYLQTKGVPASKLQTDGKGEKEPVANNTTTEGKAQNRRVVFTRL